MTAYIRKHPDDPNAFLFRGNSQRKKKEYDKAVNDYNEAIRLDKKFVSAFYDRAVAFIYMKEYDKAINDYNEAIRLDPTLYAGALNIRAFAYRAKKEYDKAINDYTEEIRRRPHVSQFAERGVVYQEKKAYDKAISDYNEAIRLDAKYYPVYSDFAWLLATCQKDKVRDGKRAVELATRACEMSHWLNPQYVSVLAAAHAECGDFKEAVRWQKKAIALGYEENEELQKERGLGYDAKEELNKARKRLRLYEERKPYRE